MRAKHRIPARYVVILIAVVVIGAGIVNQAYAFPQAWAIPQPARCIVIPDPCESTQPWLQPWIAGVDTGGDRAAQGVKVSVSFPNTSPNVIQSDNELGAGIMVYGPSVNNDISAVLAGVDYAYYGFVDVNNDGSVRFVSTIWITCEWDDCPSTFQNPPAVCYTGPNNWSTCHDGQHWELTNIRSPCGGCSFSDKYRIEIQWGSAGSVCCGTNPALFWTYYRNNVLVYQTLYIPIPSWQVGAGLKVGSGPVRADPNNSAWYHFQFGVTSLYNIGSGGWEVDMENPLYTTDSINSTSVTWNQITGGKVYPGWKAFYDSVFKIGGAGYDGVTTTSCQTGNYQLVRFQYTGPTQLPGQDLWQSACNLSLTANPTSVPADGNSVSTITVQTSSNAPGVVVSFSATHGILSASSCTTGSAGACSITVRSSTSGTATITGSADGYNSAQATVTFTALGGGGGGGGCPRICAVSPTPDAETLSATSSAESKVDGVWMAPTELKWHHAQVTVAFPGDLAAVAVSIHGNPNFKAYIDVAALSITGDSTYGDSAKQTSPQGTLAAE